MVHSRGCGQNPATPVPGRCWCATGTGATGRCGRRWRRRCRGWAWRCCCSTTAGTGRPREPERGGAYRVRRPGGAGVPGRAAGGRPAAGGVLRRVARGGGGLAAGGGAAAGGAGAAVAVRVLDLDRGSGAARFLPVILLLRIISTSATQFRSADGAAAGGGRGPRPDRAGLAQPAPVRGRPAAKAAGRAGRRRPQRPRPARRSPAHGGAVGVPGRRPRTARPVRRGGLPPAYLGRQRARRSPQSCRRFAEETRANGHDQGSLDSQTFRPPSRGGRRRPAVRPGWPDPWLRRPGDRAAAGLRDRDQLPRPVGPGQGRRHPRGRLRGGRPPAPGRGVRRRRAGPAAPPHPRRPVGRGTRPGAGPGPGQPLGGRESSAGRTIWFEVDLTGG